MVAVLRKIIRFEDARGVGIYAADAPCTDDMYEDMRHPPPEDDSKLWVALRNHAEDSRIGSWYFGFGSKKQARFWIYKTLWLRRMDEAGFVVSEYMCKREHTIIGDTQAIFLSHDSKQSFSILKYFKIKA